MWLRKLHLSAERCSLVTVECASALVEAVSLPDDVPHIERSSMTEMPVVIPGSGGDLGATPIASSEDLPVELRLRKEVAGEWRTDEQVPT